MKNYNVIRFVKSSCFLFDVHEEAEPKPFHHHQIMLYIISICRGSPEESKRFEVN